MTTTYQLLVNGVDVTPVAEWDATWEERVDGVGQATVTIQDRSNDPSLNYGRKRDEIQMYVDGFPVFHGEITGARLDLPPGRPWRRWKITASDFNTVMDLRLVGAADGYHWHSIDGGETYAAYDPQAVAQGSDLHTVQHLWDWYVRLPAGFSGGTTFHAGPAGGRAFQIAAFVFHYIPRHLLYDPATGEERLRWTNSTMRAALDELAGLASFPIFCWIDPDDHVHWETFHDPFTSPGGLTTMGPKRKLRAAPAIVTDDPNHTTSIGGRGLSIGYDGTYMPEQAYITGVTDYVHNGGTTRFQGTGWEHRDINDLEKRQIIADAQAVTEAQKDAVAAHYRKFSNRARISGSVTVGSPTESVDTWRCGQYLTVVDARLPAALNNKAWPILAVHGSLKAGNDFRVYTLEFGDAPIGRFSQKYRQAPQRMATKRLPANVHRITMPTTHLRPSTSYTIHSQMVDHSGKPVRQTAVPVVWSLVVKDGTGATVSAGSISSLTSVTDEHGRSAATLTTGTGTDLHYHVFARTSPQ